MGGKAALLVVLGFSLIFLVAGTNFNRLATNSVVNMSTYYNQTNVYNLASSAANMACNKIYFDQSWSAGYQNLKLGNGTINVTVQNLLNPRKVYIKAVATVDTFKKEINIALEPRKFSQYAYYSAYEPSNIKWATGDSVFGPMHVQGVLQVQGMPVFQGKVTIQDSIHYEDPGRWVQQIVDYRCTSYDRRGRCRNWEPVYEWVWVPGSDNPQFNGGYETGIDVPLPLNGVSDLSNAAQANGRLLSGHDTVYVQFQEDSIKVKYTKSSKYTAYYGTTFAPNGVIFAQDAVLRLEGTVKGRYSIGVSGSSYYGKGKVFLDNDLLYSSNPKTNPGSTDLLGIVSQNDIMVTDNTANRSSIDIYASLYSQSGGFGAQNYDSRPNSGYINLYGGIQQNIRRAVGTFNSYGIVSGFSKNYKYDERLRNSFPPNYPGTGRFQIVSWFE